LTTSLPILMTSGYLRPDDEIMARDIGIRAVCAKPDALRELGELLRQALAPAASPGRPASSTNAGAPV